MLDGLLGRGFTSKCKSLIKATRARIEVVRRRAEAKQRFLKEDLVKLLANGLDINAYGRTEEFLAGSNLLASYDFIEQTCDYITGQLSCMQKQSECPEECREAVGSLIFAAARFSDLPELRDLRDLFQERYGNSLDCYVHPKFLEKLSSRPPETERRVQLLQDIASEYSIKWDSRAFEQRMATTSATAQSQPNKHGSNHVTANKYNLHAGNDSAPKKDEHDFSSKKIPELVNGSDRMDNGSGGTSRREDNTLKTNRRDISINQRPELVNGGDKMCVGREGSLSRRKESVVLLHSIGRQEARSDSHKPIGNREGSTPVGDENGIQFYEKQEVTVGKYSLNNEKDDMSLKAVKSGSSSRRKKSENGDFHHSGLNNISKGESRDGLSHEKSIIALNCREISGKRRDVSTPPDHVSERSTRKMQEEEADRLHSYQNSAIPPPYVKSKDSFLPPPYTKPRDRKHRNGEGSKHANSDYDVPSVEPSPRNRVIEIDHSDRIHVEVVRSKHEGQSSEPTAVNIFGSDDIVHNQGNMLPLPKPRSVRRKHHKSSSHQNDVGRSEDAGATRRSSSSKRRDHQKKGLQILFDDEHHQKDEEERMIDKLLLHYSKKPSDYDIGKLRKKSHAHPTHSRNADAGDSSHDQSREEHDGESEYIPPPSRSVSLPHEQTAPPENIKVFTRANSFQPDNQARHVHPKLPDYDDLAARFAALRGR